jgi:hypothetical protein
MSGASVLSKRVHFEKEEEKGPAVQEKTNVRKRDDKADLKNKLNEQKNANLT